MSGRLILTELQARALYRLMGRGYDEYESEHEPGDPFNDHTELLKVGDVLVTKMNRLLRHEGWKP